MTIKQRPTDFVVEERLAESFRESIRTTQPDGAGGHALFILRKSGVTTPQAILEVAKRLRVPPGGIGYAGLKDRHAETSQHISVPLTAGLRGAGPRNLEHRGWKLERLGWIDSSIHAAAIDGNRFTIVVRGLTERGAKAMDRAARLLAIDSRLDGAAGEASAAAPAAPGGNARHLLIANYFGDQRFGGADARRELLAPYLLRGEYEKALRLAIATPRRKDQRIVKEFRRLLSEQWGDWSTVLPLLPRCPERRAIEHLAREATDFAGAFSRLPNLTQMMAVESYQSLLFNGIAARLVVDRCGELGDVIVADDPWGDLAFPAASIVPSDLRDLEIPLLAPTSELREPWRAAAEAVLEQEGITIESLRLPGLERPWFGEAMRPLFVRATNFALSPTSPDDTAPRPGRFRRSVRFDLPRGAYATVVLRALGE